MSTFDVNAASTVLNTISKRLVPIIATEMSNGTVYDSYKKVATYRSTADRYTTETGIGDLAMGEFVPDGGISTTQIPTIGFTKTWVQIEGRLTTKISYQNMLFMFIKGDKSEIVKGMGPKLKKQIINVMTGLEKLKDYYMQAHLSQGFTTSFTFQSLSQQATVAPILVDTTTGDGIAYWSESHLREDGGTVWSNVIRSTTPSPVLSEASIAAANRIHSLKKDATGSPLSSTLDTVVVVRGSLAAQEAKRIKAMLDKGLYPAVTPGVSGSFNEAARIQSFDIIELNYWGTLGLTQTDWYMFDSKMMNEDFGFQYIVAQEGELINHPIALNLDYTMTGVTLFQIGMRDARGWMASAGDDTTT